MSQDTTLLKAAADWKTVVQQQATKIERRRMKSDANTTE